jgi:Uma2 family endonuclease
MSAQPAYHFPVEHPPRFLAHGLPSDGTLTVDDLRAFPDDPYWKYELLEGTLTVSPNAPGLGHQSCAGTLYRLLWAAFPREFKVVIAPFEYLPNRLLSVQPDVLVARRPIGEKRLEQTPVLVAEVLSPSTRSYDRKRKRAAYEKLGIEHFWVVDPAGPSIEALRLVDGAYEPVVVAEAGGTFEVGDPVKLAFDPVVLLDE